MSAVTATVIVNRGIVSVVATGSIGPAGPPVADGQKADIIVSGSGTVYRLNKLSETSYNLRAGNGPYTVDIGDRMAWIGDDGSVFFGQNFLCNYSANDLGRMQPDFLWDARALRLAVRNLTMGMVADPCDLNMRRWGPGTLGFPYVASGTGDGSFDNLTGLAADTAIAQVRSTPAWVPYGVGNDQNTTGSQAQETNVALTFKTDGMARRVTGDGQASVGGKFEINIAPKNAHDFRETYFVIKSEGYTYIGNKAVDEGNTSALVNIRTHEGTNCSQRITVTGTPTGGTFKLIFWEPPQSDTTFSLGATTAAIAYNADATAVQTALLAAINGLAGNVPGTATAWSAVAGADVTVSGGPLPGATMDIEFTGVLATTRILRIGITEKAFTGGTSPNVSMTRLNQVGVGSQKGLHVLRVSGCTGQTGDYLRVINGASTILNLSSAGKLYTSGELEIDGALNHDGTTVGFRGLAPVAMPTAYTQTYNTATRTHAAFTAGDITGIASSTTGTALAEPGAAYVQAEMQQNFRRLQDQHNLLKADLANLKQLVNSMIDDRQADGLAQ